MTSYKVRYGKDTFPLTVTPESTLEELMAEIRDVTGVFPSKQDILFNYPPQSLPNDAKSLPIPLEALGVAKREMFQLRIRSKDANYGPSHQKSALEEAIKYPISSDNSCLFNSIAYLCTGNANKARELREHVISEIRAKPDVYTPATLGCPVDEYCTWIRDPKNWGGYIEMEILSRYYKVEICVLHIEDCQPVFINACNAKKRIYILYDNIHYDSVFFRGFGVDERRIVDKEDDKALNLALEMTKIIQQSGGYVNTNKCKMVCEQCGAIVHGQKEAEAHGKKTGHIRFSQTQ